MPRIQKTCTAILVAAALAAGCQTSGACDPADLSPPPRPPAYAVVSSDYFSTAIALLDADGALLDEAFVDSGSAPPGVVAALSGDVALPTAPLAPCVLTLIDRYPADVITFLDVCGGEPVLGQMEVGDGFGANPHDVLALDGDRALISRHDPSPDGSAGDDLLIVDWRELRPVARIELSGLDVEVDGAHVYARPSRMVRLRAGDAERVVVGLARLDRSFMVAGPGAVAWVDVDAGTAEAIELPGLRGCDEVDPVPGHPELAAVTCGGPAFTDEEGRRATSGVVLVALGADGSATVRASWRASEHRAQPVYNTWAVPIDAERIVVTAMGDLSLGLDDRVGVLSMGGAQPSRLMEASDAFVIGDGSYDPERGLLLVPDAEAGVVRRFSRDGGGFVEMTPVDTAGCRGLVPREVRALSSR